MGLLSCAFSDEWPAYHRMPEVREQVPRLYRHHHGEPGELHVLHLRAESNRTDGHGGISCIHGLGRLRKAGERFAGSLDYLVSLRPA